MLFYKYIYVFLLYFINTYIRIKIQSLNLHNKENKMTEKEIEIIKPLIDMVICCSPLVHYIQHS